MDNPAKAIRLAWGSPCVNIPLTLRVGTCHISAPRRSTSKKTGSLMDIWCAYCCSRIRSLAVSSSSPLCSFLVPLVVCVRLRQPTTTAPHWTHSIREFSSNLILDSLFLGANCCIFWYFICRRDPLVVLPDQALLLNEQTKAVPMKESAIHCQKKIRKCLESTERGREKELKVRKPAHRALK